LIKRENKKRKLWSDLSSLILQEKDSLQQSNTGKQTIPRRYYHSATNKQGGKRKKIKAKTRVHQRPHDQYGTGLLRPETWQLQHFQGEKKLSDEPNPPPPHLLPPPRKIVPDEEQETSKTKIRSKW
jgi:hypothetical protein